MGVRYEKLFQLLRDRKMTTRELQKLANFSGNITTRMDVMNISKRPVPVHAQLQNYSDSLVLIVGSLLTVDGISSMKVK